MKSRTLFCNKTVFKWDITQFWPFWVISILVLQCVMTLAYAMSCLNVVQHAITYVEKKSQVKTYLRASTTQIISNEYYLCGVAVMALIAAVMVFQYLHRKRSVYAIHSMPVKRSTLFTTHFLTGFIMLLVPFLLAWLGVGSIAAVRGLHMTGAIVGYALETIIMCLFFYSLAVFLIMLSGNSIISSVMYVVINVLAYGFQMLMKMVPACFHFGNSTIANGRLDKSGVITMMTPLKQFTDWISLQSPADSMWEKAKIAKDGMAINQFHSQVVLKCSYYLIPAVLFIAFASYLYHKRQLERMDDMLVFSWSKVIFRIVFSMCGSLVLTYAIQYVAFSLISYKQTYRQFFYTGMILLSVCVVICYVVCDMMFAKTFHVWKKVSWFQAGMLVGVMLVLFFVEHSCINERMSIVADEVLQLVITGSDNEYTIKEPERIKDAIAYCMQIVERGQKSQVTGWNAGYVIDEYSYQISFRYELKDGREIEGSYPVNVKNSEELLLMLQKFLNDKNYLVESLNPDNWTYQNNISRISIYDLQSEESDYYLDDISSPGLYDALMKDLREGNILVSPFYIEEDKPIWKGDDPLYSINLEMHADKDEYGNYQEYKYFNFELTEKCVNTMQYLRQKELID